ncbi:MAG: hypothetical protein DRN96_05120 [Thermoproteota archaeon]|nr:MAG: hypothetical protein DRN96_05120 [Candidatus Korarchaeota archaeon]
MEEVKGSRRPISLPEAKEILDRVWSTREEEDLEITQRSIRDYVRRFSKINADKARKLVKFLVEEVGISEKHAIQLVNIVPLTRDEIRVFLFKDYPLLTGEKYDEILRALKAAIEAS